MAEWVQGSDCRLQRASWMRTGAGYWVETEPGGGSAFLFEIPLALEPDAGASPDLGPPARTPSMGNSS